MAVTGAFIDGDTGLVAVVLVVCDEARLFVAKKDVRSSGPVGGGRRDLIDVSLRC